MNCDCACHPENNPQQQQYKFQFGTIILANKEEPCWCCWCHYEKNGENNG